MKLTAQVKLQPTPDQHDVLLQTLRAANDVCNHITDVAWSTSTFGQFKLHRLVYSDVRGNSNLSAQLVVRCIAKVADAYKLDKKCKRTFRPHGSIAYDDRILRWYVNDGFVSIWTAVGRMKIPFICGHRQRQLLESRRGESDLVYRDGSWYLLATCSIGEPGLLQATDAIGVDLGIVNIAVDSDSGVFSGAAVNGLRSRHRKLRQRLQAKGTKSARRLLKRRRRKERRFASDVNHCISKAIVAKAQDTGRAIALEDLKGIRSRTTVKKSQRATHSSWAFFQLRSFINYKAAFAGVPVIFVDPKNTSRTCPVCGCTDKRNRISQERFSCVACGFAGPADHIAAVNIRSRAVVNLPYAAAA